MAKKVEKIKKVKMVTRYFKLGEQASSFTDVGAGLNIAKGEIVKIVQTHNLKFSPTTKAALTNGHLIELDEDDVDGKEVRDLDEVAKVAANDGKQAVNKLSKAKAKEEEEDEEEEDEEEEDEEDEEEEDEEEEDEEEEDEEEEDKAPTTKPDLIAAIKKHAKATAADKKGLEKMELSALSEVLKKLDTKK